MLQVQTVCFALSFFNFYLNFGLAWISRYSLDWSISTWIGLFWRFQPILFDSTRISANQFESGPSQCKSACIRKWKKKYSMQYRRTGSGVTHFTPCRTQVWHPCNRVDAFQVHRWSRCLILYAIILCIFYSMYSDPIMFDGALRDREAKGLPSWGYVFYFWERPEMVDLCFNFGLKRCSFKMPTPLLVIT